MDGSKFKNCFRDYDLVNYLHVIAGVDKERVGVGLDIDPVAFLLQLKAIYAILEEDCEETMVGVGREPHG